MIAKLIQKKKGEEDLKKLKKKKKSKQDRKLIY